MTFDKGAGYVFGTGYDGITVLAPDPKQIGQPTAWTSRPTAASCPAN